MVTRARARVCELQVEHQTLKRFTGANFPSYAKLVPVVVDGPLALVVFSSDATIQRAGFSLTYQAGDILSLECHANTNPQTITNFLNS